MKMPCLPVFKNPHLYLIISLIYLSHTSLADTKFPKWGKVTKEEIELQKVSYEEDAHAVVISKTGHLTFIGGKFLIKKYVRIKILDKEGISEADIIESYYSKNNLEKIEQVKAQTLEILENGKVVKHPLEKNQIFDVQKNENWSEIRFAMPAVKVGSIIEYTYNLYSENFTFLEGWVFQSNKPVLQSSFKAEIPGHLRYQLLMHGSRMVRKYLNEKPTNNWVLNNLPALKYEPYTYNLMDYAEKISFQLNSYDKRDIYNNIKEEKVFVNWQDISQEILTTYSFRSYLNGNKEADAIIQSIPVLNDSLPYAKAIYAYVQRNYKWNGQFGLLPDINLKDLRISQTGNGTSINLLLVGLLQKTGFDAQPTYLSTKGHGRVSPQFPFLSQFNHVIALVRIEGKEYLLDAAGNNLAFGILPVRDLNHKAMALSKKDARWLDVIDYSKSNSIISYYGDLGSGKHKFECQWSGYEALAIGEKFRQDRNGDQFLHSIDRNLTKDSVQYANELSEKNTISARLFFSEVPELNAEKIYYSIPVFDWISENPFKTEQRNLPIDFGFTSTKILLYNIALPEGYSIEEQPENLSIITPNREATFNYLATNNGNSINIQIKFDIKESMVPAENYLYLRELYSRMINHCQKAYVLTRN